VKRQLPVVSCQKSKIGLETEFSGILLHADTHLKGGWFVSFAEFHGTGFWAP